MSASIPTKNLGKLVLGARPLALEIFDDEGLWRRCYGPEIRRDFGLFLMGTRLAGYRGVIRAVRKQKLKDAFAGRSGRRRRRKGIGTTEITTNTA
jgi:hypothetical protein